MKNVDKLISTFYFSNSIDTGGAVIISFRQIIDILKLNNLLLDFFRSSYGD